MTIVVEDGSQVSGANSYNSVADFRAYCTARGYTLPTADAACEPFLVRAFDWIEAKRTEFKGTKTDVVQPNQWPRTGVWIDNAVEEDDMFPDDAIPVELTHAHCEAAYIASTGISLTPVSSGPFVKRRKLDVLEMEFSETLNTSGLPLLPSVDALLAPILNDGGDISLRTVRV